MRPPFECLYVLKTTKYLLRVQCKAFNEIVWHFVLAVFMFNIGSNKKICYRSRRAAWLGATCDQIFSRNKSFSNENNGKGFKMLKHLRLKNPAIRDPKSFNYVAKTWNWLFCRSGLLVPMYLSEEEGTRGKTIPTVAGSPWQFLPFFLELKAESFTLINRWW